MGRRKAVALDISDDELSLSDEERLDGGDDGQRAIDSQDARASEPCAQSPTKVYVGLDGKMKFAAKEETEEPKVIIDAGASSSYSSSTDTDGTTRVPQHDETPEEKTPLQQAHASKQKKSSSLPKRPIPTRKCIRSNRFRQKVDACTSCDLDNIEMTRDMSELHVKQLQHRESVEVFRKAEVNLKVRVQRTTDKELELRRKEAELKEREDRVTRVAENLRKQQHVLRQREDALKAHQANGRNLGYIATGKTNDEPKPTIDPSIVAEVKGLKRKLFRSERRVQKREEQIRALFKRLSRLSKVHQRLVEETKANVSGEEADRSSWLIERSTNRDSAGGKRGAGANRKRIKKKTPHTGTKKRQDLTTDQSAPKDTRETSGTKWSNEKQTIWLHQPPTCTAEKEGASTKSTEMQSNPSELPKPTGKPSVSFSPNVEVTRIPPPPSPVGTPARTRRAAYTQQAKAEIIPLSSEKIRQSLASEET